MVSQCVRQKLGLYLLDDSRLEEFRYQVTQCCEVHYANPYHVQGSPVICSVHFKEQLAFYQNLTL